MAFSSMSLDYTFYNDDETGFCTKKLNPFGYYYTDTKLYKYHEKHPELHTLTEIISENKGYSLDSFLCNCYTKILDNGMDYIIYDVVSEPIDNDEVAICMTAIDKNKLDIIDFLVSKKFNPKQMVLQSQQIYLDFDILTYAVRKNNLPIVKYLVENGASPCENNMCAMRAAFSLKSDDIFDFFINLDIPYQTLCLIVSYCCNFDFRRNNNPKKYEKLKKLFNKGIDVNYVACTIDKCIGKFPVDMIKFLIDSGLDINSNRMLYRASAASNYELVDFLLQQGLQIDAESLNIIFEKLDMNMIEVLIKYNIPLSSLKPIKDHIDMANKLDALGMEKDVFLSLIMEKIKQPADDGFYQRLMMNRSAEIDL